MQTEYLDRLPDDLYTLVERIEQGSGVEITVEVDPSRAREMPDKPDTLACEVDQSGAKLKIPAPEFFPDGSVLHEVLHIRRFLLNGVPKIVVCEDYLPPELAQMDEGLAMLDNSLEHLVIVPEELKRRPERKAYWEAVMHRLFDGIQSANLSSVDREHLSLINWVFIQHVLSDRNLIEKASAFLKCLGVTTRAEQLRDEIVSSLHLKEKTVKACFEHLGIQLEGVCLQYIDSKNCRSCEIPLVKVDV